MPGLEKTLEMTILIRAINQTTGAFGGVRLAALATLGAIGAGLAYSVKQAADFQTGLTVLSTGADETAKSLGAVGNGIKQISIDTGTTTDQLLKGMFMVESAGYHLANGGLDVLKVAAEGAKLENTDLGATAFSLTGLLHDYGMKTTQAGAAMSALIETEASGKMHMSDLTKSLGNVLPLASALKISFPEIGAAIAVMTNSNMSALRATQNLNFLLRALAAPGNTAVSAMQVVGISAQQVKDKLQGPDGLLGALTLIEDAVGKKFPQSSVEYTAALKDIMGGATGWNTALKLSGSHLQEMQKDIKNISSAMGNSTTLTSKWAQMQGTFNFQLDQTKAALNVAAIDVGTVLIPVLERLLAWVTPGITAFTNWATSAHGLQAAVNNVVGGITNLVQGAVNLYQAFQQGQPWVIAIATGLTSLFVALKLIAIEETVAGWVNWFNTMREGNGVIANIAGNALPNLSQALGWQRVAQDEATASTAAGTAAAAASATAQQQSALQIVAAAYQKKAAMADAEAAIAELQYTEAALSGTASTEEIIAFQEVTLAAEAKAAKLQAAATAAEAAVAQEAAAVEVGAVAEEAAATGAAAAITLGLGVATAGISVLVGAALVGFAQAAASGQLYITKLQQSMDQLGNTAQDTAMKQKAAAGDAIIAYQQQQQASDDTAAKQKANAAQVQGVAQASATNSSRAWQDSGKQMQIASGNAKAQFITDQQQMKDAAARDAASAASSWSNFVSQMHQQGIDPINGGKWNPSVPSTPQRGRVAGANLNNTDQSWNVGHASGIMNSPYGHWATVGERGPELMYVPKGANIYPNGTGPGGGGGGGHTINVFVSTMAGSRAEVMRMVDLLEREIAHRFRSQTPSFALPGLT